MLAFFVLPLLPLLLAGLGFLLKKSLPFSIGGNFVFLFMTLLWILCLIHYLLALILGILCAVIEAPEALIAVIVPAGGHSGTVAPTPSATPTPTGSSGGSGVPNLDFLANLQNADPVTLGLTVLNQCMQPGGNIMDALNLTDALDFNSTVNQYFNSSMITGALDQFNISSLLGASLDFGALDLSTVTTQMASLTTGFNMFVNLIRTVVVQNNTILINEAVDLLEAYRDNSTFSAVSQFFVYDFFCAGRQRVCSCC